MIMQRVKFRSKQDRDALWAVARDREGEYRKVPGLLQKFYVEFNEPNTYGGYLIWDSMASMAAFRETELSQTIAAAYGVDGAPYVEVGTIEIVLHDAVMVAA